MKILVTGAAGFLGSWIAEKLLGMGHQVSCVDSMVGGSLDNLESLGENRFWKKRFKEWMDIRDLEGVSEACKGCDVVYHCAALAYEGLSVFSPSMVVGNIVGGTVSVATAAIRNGVKRFVNCSSMARYGVTATPYEEDMMPLPVDPYGAAKLAAERQLNILGAIHGMKVIHAVPHNIYGPRQKYDDPYRNVAAIFVNRMLQGKPPIIYGDGQQVRCFSYMDDVLPTMLALLDADVEHGEVFNVGPDHSSGSRVTVEKLAEIVSGLLEYEERPVFVGDRPCEVKVATCSNQKIRSRFGFEQKTSLEIGLWNLIEYIKERGPKPFDYHLPIEIDSPKLPRTWKERIM